MKTENMCSIIYFTRRSNNNSLPKEPPPTSKNCKYMKYNNKN